MDVTEFKRPPKSVWNETSPGLHDRDMDAGPSAHRQSTPPGC